jgi:protein-S-isoprenylcysteine O-methyltransferase Ste14
VARPSHPAPPPLQVDTARVVLAGTAVWAVALVVLLVLGDRVDPAWRWTCVAGIVLAGLGLALMRWQGQLRPRRPQRAQRTSKSEVS